MKEYTVIPDFSRLDYEIMALTFLKHQESPSKEDMPALRERAANWNAKALPWP